MAKFQVMPDLAPDEYEALKADIAKRGVQIPVLIDEAGNVLDGHHRRRAADELGVDCPMELRGGLSKSQKLELAVSLNINRRHLSRDQREEMWIAMRQDGMSYRQISEADGTVSFKTVQRTVSSDTVDLPDTVTGKDGKKRAAVKARADAMPASAEMSQEEREALEQALKDGGRMIAEAAERRANNKRIARGLGEKFPLSPQTKKAQAIARAVMARLKAVDVMLKHAEVRPQFDHHWGAAVDRARSILRQLEQLA